MTPMNVRQMMLSKELNQRKWKFIANPACCEKCSLFNGHVVNSPIKPTFSPHDPMQANTYNCMCHWIEVTE